MVAVPRAPLLQASGLEFAYGRRPVLRGVDLGLGEGELVAVLGPNGGGKSTLLGLMAGLLRPRRGQVRLAGRPLEDYRRRELATRLALVPQAAGLAPGLSVLGAVLAGRYARMGGRLFESRQDLAAARLALESTGLADLEERPAGALSGGERQRLALARTLAAEPRLLLLDEPTSALDPAHQLQVMALLERLCREQGRGVCLVSHDLNLAALYCDRLVILHRGELAACGAPVEVLDPELIERVYGVASLVDREPARGRPRVTLLPAARDADQGARPPGPDPLEKVRS